MKAIWTILLLIASNVFMTFAWYGHLKLQEMKISSGWPLIVVILFSSAADLLEPVPGLLGQGGVLQRDGVQADDGAMRLPA